MLASTSSTWSEAALVFVFSWRSLSTASSKLEELAGVAHALILLSLFTSVPQESTTAEMAPAWSELDWLFVEY